MLVVRRSKVVVVVRELASHQIKCKKKLAIVKRVDERLPVETMMIMKMKITIATLTTIMITTMITR